MVRRMADVKFQTTALSERPKAMRPIAAARTPAVPATIRAAPFPVAAISRSPVKSSG